MLFDACLSQPITVDLGHGVLTPVATCAGRRQQDGVIQDEPLFHRLLQHRMQYYLNVSELISSLVQYSLDCGLIESCDTNFMTNQLLQALCLDSFEPAAPVAISLEAILKGLVDDAVRRGICGEHITSRDLLDTKLMGILTPPPERYGRN